MVWASGVVAPLCKAERDWQCGDMTVDDMIRNMPLKLVEEELWIFRHDTRLPHFHYSKWKYIMFWQSWERKRGGGL